MTDFEKYIAWYNSHPWWWRLWNRAHWRLLTIWCALTGKPTPMERRLIDAWQHRKD